MVADSLLVQQINNVAIAWLVANGAEEPEAKLLIQRLVNSLPGNMLVVVTENAVPLAFSSTAKIFPFGDFIISQFARPRSWFYSH
ncbi:hypothetical protein [Nostoc sp.]|uniref:hypothetical protein n=1 Tax=Nostoc sp. TaxID=1180 RepID=UPI003FA539DD